MAVTFNEIEIRKTIEILKPNGQLFEVRAIYGNKTTWSGYFRDADSLIKAMHSLNPRDVNVYISLNEISDACFSRSQQNVFEKNPKNTTSDKDVNGYEWLFIDLDPDRPSGTSSSNEELQESKDVGNKIFYALQNMGFEKPIRALSGNGVHLLYRISLENTKERSALLKKCLEVLDAMFSTEKVKVDLKNFNPSRVCKLYGCLAQKGTSTQDRPHRPSYIIGDIESHNDVKVTNIAYLKKLAAVIPDEPPKPQKYNNYAPQKFDIEAWMQKYGIGYKVESYQGGTKYVLDHCVFNENHKGKDAVIFKAANGALSYVCLHNSCADKHWRDVRIKYEPNAYEKQWQADEQRMYGRFNRDRKEPPKIEPTEDEPVFLTAEMILQRKQPEESYIKTGITTIDKKMLGLKKGHVSVWSGLRASGKSSVLSQIILKAIDDGNNAAAYSGELRERKFLDWMILQAAGKGHTRPSQNEGFYFTPENTALKIAKWLGQHFWLYNNIYGNNYRAVMSEFVKKIEENKLDLLVLDNLMTFNISDMGASKWDAQTAFVLDLANIAKQMNVHIAFVAHPKKANGFLRFDDISGTADLGNAVDDAFIVHRVNNDFRRMSSDMFGWKDEEAIYSGTNVIEIVKDRDGGAQDVFIPLYYEVESKRLKNDIAENVVYGWDSTPQFAQSSLQAALSAGPEINPLPDKSLVDFEIVTDDNITEDNPFA